MKALVLLGYRNAGKDSICEALKQHYKQKFPVYNIKFGEYNKRLAAELIDVPRYWLDDKKWRVDTKFLGDFSPLDLLNALFAFSKDNEQMLKNIDECALGQDTSAGLAVFTDVRRVRELNAVLKKYGGDEVFVCEVWRSGLLPSDGDEHVNETIDYCLLERNLYKSLEDNVSTLVQDINKRCSFANLKPKPTLHLLLGTPVKNAILPSTCYEPLANLLKATEKFLSSANADVLATSRVLNAVFNEIPTQEFDLPPVEENSYMVFDFANYSRFLPRLREQATLRLHFTNTRQLDTTVFTTEEIAHATNS